MRGASIEHTLNLGSGIGAVCAQASEASSTNRDKPLTQVEAIVKPLVARSAVIPTPIHPASDSKRRINLNAHSQS